MRDNMNGGMVKISFAGDVMCLKEETNAVLRRYGRLDYTGYLSGLKPLFASSDFTMANLETPLGAMQETSDGTIRFNAPREFAKALKEVGFNFFSTANNHCLDRGVDGITTTIDVLDELGFSHSGTYTTAIEAERIAMAEVDGVTIAIVCSTYGTNSDTNGVLLNPGEEWRVDLLRNQFKPRRLPQTEDMSNGNFRTYIADCVSPAAIANAANLPYVDRIAGKVRRAKGVADFVIAMPHVGGQFNPGPAAYAKWIVEQMRFAGADMVVAGHPHVPQRCEAREGGLFIAYSLGNLCFTPGVGFFVRNVLADYGCVLHAYVDKMTKRVAKLTFDVVKSIVDEDGCARTVPVVDLIDAETNAAKKDRLWMENEAVVNRFRGSGAAIVPKREYEMWEGNRR